VLTASDGGGLFGRAVAISGDKVAAGAPSNFLFTGSAYLFYRNQNKLDMWRTNKSGSDDLNEAEKLILKRLKEWRKEKVEKQGIPVFIVATNRQLMDVIRRVPVTLEALRDVHGFGKKKIERYGKEARHPESCLYAGSNRKDRPRD